MLVFFGNDDTFYPGIKAIPPYSTFSVSGGNSKEVCDFSRMIFKDNFKSTAISEADKYYDSITEKFVSGMNTFKSDKTLNLQLSGRKDSRLILAGMSSAKLDISANTTDMGAHNFTDVYCAKLVASSLGIQHNLRKIAKREAEATISSDEFYTRTVNTLKATDFGLISLGNLAFNQKFSNNRLFNGLGGELLRGGYEKGLAKLNVKYSPKELLISKWARFSKFFYPEAADAYSSYLDNWLEANGLNENLSLAADAGYLYCRMGRWTGALSRSGSLARIPTYPFLDNAFMKSVYSGPVEFRSNDKLLYEILKRLNPDLAKIPFANDYWSFLSSKDVVEFKNKWPDAFRERNSIQSGENLDWRANWIDIISEHLFDFILSFQESRVFEVLNRKKIEALRLNGLNRGHRFLLFSIYSALIACSPSFQQGVYNTSIGIDALTH
jgi:asparagine synthetase B (glutamine-hydrolysing)